MDDPPQWAHAKLLIAKDKAAPRREYLVQGPEWLSRMIVRTLWDPRDLPMALLALNIALTTVPSACLVWFIGSGSSPIPCDACDHHHKHWVGAVHVAWNLAVFNARYFLLLHTASHRPPFRSAALNWAITHGLGLFFGLPPGVYYLHHCVMHHVENNAYPWDVSSTEPYQRDSILHFVFYWLRFAFAIWVELPWHALRRRRYALCAQCLLTSAATVVAVRWLYQRNPVGCTWVFVVPAIVTSLALMLGNWSQHIFIVPKRSRHASGDSRAGEIAADRAANFRHTYNVLASPYNQKTFNDGYHIEHHINSRRHWTELPASCEHHLAEHARHGSLLFRSLDFFMVGMLVFAQQWDVLARHVVDLNDPPRRTEEIVRMLKVRVEPIRSPLPSPQGNG